jgi:hypothetical protein
MDWQSYPAAVLIFGFHILLSIKEGTKKRPQAMLAGAAQRLLSL